MAGVRRPTEPAPDTDVAAVDGGGGGGMALGETNSDGRDGVASDCSGGDGTRPGVASPVRDVPPPVPAPAVP